MWSLPSALLNLLFVLSASFIFLGLGSNYKLVGMDRWQVMLFMLIILSLVYFLNIFSFSF